MSIGSAPGLATVSASLIAPCENPHPPPPRAPPLDEIGALDACALLLWTSFPRTYSADALAARRAELKENLHSEKLRGRLGAAKRN